MDKFSIATPDDFHVHFRQGDMLKLVVPETARHFSRALVMPNVPAIETAAQALEYENEIRRAAEQFEFTPLLSLKLTHRTTPEMIRTAKAAGCVAAKIYPQGATTASEDGIRDVKDPLLISVFRAMQDCGMVLCIHAEDPEVFVMDREAKYLDQVQWIVRYFPGLKVVVEHITTKTAVKFVQSQSVNVAATITVHHLLHTLDDVVGNGLRPHNYCKPIAKRPEDRNELVAAAFHQNGGRFFLGTDSAPHRAKDKESACGCAGVFSAPVAMALLADIFVDRPTKFHTDYKFYVGLLQAFTSERGADFYGLLRNTGTITMERKPWRVPEKYGDVVPLMAGQELQWQVVRTEGR